MAKNYIPYQDAQFDEWAENFTAQLPAIATAIGDVPPALVTAVTTGYTNWDIAFDAHQVAKNASKAATEVKDEEKVTLKSDIRLVTQLIQKNPSLTDAQRQTLGITIPDLIRTSLSPDYVVNLEPPLLLLESKRGQVTIHFGINPSDERSNAKPEGIAGAKIWVRQDEGPWKFVADDTNSPYNHNLIITEPANLEYRTQWFDNKMRAGIFSESAKCSVTP